MCKKYLYTFPERFFLVHLWIHLQCHRPKHEGKLSCVFPILNELELTKDAHRVKHVHLDSIIQATGSSYMVHQTFHAVFMDFPNLQSTVDSADSLKNSSASFDFTSGLNPDEFLYGVN